MGGEQMQKSTSIQYSASGLMVHADGQRLGRWARALSSAGHGVPRATGRACAWSEVHGVVRAGVVLVLEVLVLAAGS